ncbi:MAG TPA: hypothetical protein VFH88_13155 [Candidatus Krumholzibacteria bacterium]|nr:hypothetical protein [Candidatus Krumholzibacteria bacterium]
MRATDPAGQIRCVLALWAVVTVMLPAGARARDVLSGRVYVTYQNFDRTGGRQEYLSERFEATLRDRVFERNNLAATFYFDNSRDLVLNQTIRRYRGMLDLSNPYYTLNARYTPRQTTNAIEQPRSVEFLDKQLLLDVHVPDVPRVRLSYGTTQRFVQGWAGNKTTTWRGDLSYMYRVFSLALNRYRTTSENSVQRTTDVTGVDLRAAHVFSPLFTFDAGYQYQFTRIDPTVGLTQDITHNAFTGIFTSRYRRLVQTNLTLNRRYLTNESSRTFKNTDDNDRLSALFFPLSPVTLEIADTFVRTKQDTLVSRAHYGTLQVLADTEVWKKTRGLLQLTRQFDINTVGSIVPDHLYIARLESFDRRGLDMRAEASVSERVDDNTRSYRFRNTTLFDIYLRPRRTITITPRATFTNFGDDVAFTHNDQASYGLNGTWLARSVNLGMNLTHSAITSERQSVSNSAVFSVSTSMRNRSSLSVSYGLRETDQFATALFPERYDKSKTLNVWGQLWVLPRGSLSVNYTRVDRELADDTNYVAVNYRQEF